MHFPKTLTSIDNFVSFKTKSQLGRLNKPVLSFNILEMLNQIHLTSLQTVTTIAVILEIHHCVKIVGIWSYSGSYFPALGLNNFEYEHFLHGASLDLEEDSTASSSSENSETNSLGEEVKLLNAENLCIKQNHFIRRELINKNKILYFINL